MKLFRKKYHTHTDEQLMSLLLKGEAKAFDEIYGRYGDKMYAFFYRMLYQDKNLAADFSQVLFMKVFEKASSFNKDYRFSTWLYTMANNMCKNEYRRTSRSPAIHYLEENVIKIVQPQAPANIDREIFKDQLQAALNELEDIHKKCFILRYQEELSIKEISEIMNCPQGTIKSRLYYCLKKLSEKLILFKPIKKKINDERNIR